MPWHYNPHIGGKKIPPHVQAQFKPERELGSSPTRRRTTRAVTIGSTCGSGALSVPSTRTSPRHTQRTSFVSASSATRTGGRSRSSPPAASGTSRTFFASSDDHGTPEGAFDIGAVYLAG